MLQISRHRRLPNAVLYGFALVSVISANHAVAQTNATIRKHPLGYSTALGASEVGKVYVPSRYGGILTFKSSAKLYYTNGADLTPAVADQILAGSLEGSLIAQGYPCTYTVPSGQKGWFYFVVPGGTYGITNTFIEAGQTTYRPWNGWWWPMPDFNNPNLYDPNGPFDKYDRVYDGKASPMDSVPGTTFYLEKLDVNPGWSTTGAWAWGQPTGNGGTHGGADPIAGYTGANVYGYNLTGGYTNDMTPQFLTTTAIDCSAQTGVHLRFRRWLGVEESLYDHAAVQVSNNRTDWVTVWDHNGPTLAENIWTLKEYDIAAVADSQPAVYIRWVMGPTDVGWTWGGWNIDDIELTSQPPVNAFYQQTFDSNPGWTAEGSWAFGVPIGSGGDHGGPDPKAGYTGTNVYGYNLTGGYTNNMAPTSLTTTAVDCTGYGNVHLRFHRWLNIEESIYDHAKVQVSTDQTNWVTVWDFTGPTLLETSWSLQDYNISSVADNQPTVYIRWVMGPTDVGWTWGGWNIDDVELTGATYVPSTVISFYQQALDTDPTWSTTGAWAYGTPTGKGGDHGGNDPTAGYTGTKVYGYNLAGAYTNNLGQQYLTTSAINCTGQTGIHLLFRRWLTIEESIYDHASVQVSTDQSNWVTIWDHSGPNLVENVWSLQEYDISSLADKQPTVYIRWAMGPTDVGWTWGGWNIDDIELTSGNAALPQTEPASYARTWEATNQNYGEYWFGHCWGWSIAAILIPDPQSTTKKGVYFTRDDMKGLYTELCDVDPYADGSLSIYFIPATAPTSALGQDVDAYCDDFYRIMRTSIREDKVPLQSDMRAAASPPVKVNEVWNQAIYKYYISFREVPGSNDERQVEIDMDVWSNSDSWPPPTEYTNDRYEEFVFRLVFDAQGQVIPNALNQNWVYASHYAPRDLYRLTGSPYTPKNPYIIKSRIDALYQP